MTLTIGFAVAAEHIRDFRPGAGHRPQLRSVLAVSALAPREPGAAAGPGGWTWGGPWSWVFVSTWRWKPGCDDQAAAEWFGWRCQTRVNVPQRRGLANAVSQGWIGGRLAGPFGM